MNYLHDDIAGRWILEKLNIYRPFNDITNNQSESLNRYVCKNGHECFNCRVLKDLQDWTELPIDCPALSFYHLQIFYLNEIKGVLAGTGTYHLTERFLSLKSTHYEAECVSADLPQDIVKFIRAKDDSVGERSEELT